MLRELREQQDILIEQRRGVLDDEHNLRARAVSLDASELLDVHRQSVGHGHELRGQQERRAFPALDVGQLPLRNADQFRKLVLRQPACHSEIPEPGSERLNTIPWVLDHTWIPPCEMRIGEQGCPALVPGALPPER